MDVRSAGVAATPLPGAPRTGVLHRLRWLGFSIDEAANQAGGPLLTRADSGLPAYVIPTDEEIVIARHTLGRIGGGEVHQLDV